MPVYTGKYRPAALLADLGAAPGGKRAPARGYWETLPVDIPHGSGKALPISGVLGLEFVTDIVSLAELISAGACLMVDIYHRDKRVSQ